MTIEDHKLLNLGLCGVILILGLGLAAAVYYLMYPRKPEKDPNLVTMQMRRGGDIRFVGDGPALSEDVVFRILKKIRFDQSCPLAIQIDAERDCMSNDVPKFVAVMLTNVAVREVNICVSNLPTSYSIKLEYR